MEPLDNNGTKLKVGDYVRIVDVLGKPVGSEVQKLNTEYCYFVRDVLYKITYIDDINPWDDSRRISIVHVPTGLTNGWKSTCFIKVTGTYKDPRPEWY
jgi:hypothetical protein